MYCRQQNHHSVVKDVEKPAGFSTNQDLHPAAAHSLSAISGQFARLQGEKYFRPRTRRGRKFIDAPLPLIAANPAGLSEAWIIGAAENIFIEIKKGAPS